MAKNQENVQRGQDHADLQRDAEQKVQPDRGADHLGQVGGDDGALGQDPQHEGDRPRKRIARRLRQVAPRGDPQPQRQRLQQDRHDVGQERHRKQHVAKGRATRQRCRPVARVHVTHRHQVAGAEKRQETPEKPPRADRDAGIGFRQGRGLRLVPPGAVRCHCHDCLPQMRTIRICIIFPKRARQDTQHLAARFPPYTSDRGGPIVPVDKWGSTPRGRD